MKYTFQEQQIIRIVEPAIQGLGFDLVCLEFQSGVLRVSVENPKTGTIGMDDCTEITKVISPLLEVEDPISGPYTLEVGSPGIDRPLIREADYNRYIGFEAKVELDMPLDSGQKRFRGRIVGAKEGFARLLVDNVNFDLELNNIKKAKLVLTDELIKATAKRIKELQETNTDQQTATL